MRNSQLDMYGEYEQFTWRILTVYMENTNSSHGEYQQLIWRILTVYMEKTNSLHGEN